jgi:enoyl-CoA hydratase/carnithine racemase
MSDVVLIEDRGRIRIVTMNRPHAKNAFNDDLYDEMREALNAAAGDPQVAVVVITGAEGAFSAGQDLSEMGKPRTPEEAASTGFMPFVDTLQSFPKPLIAAVNGVGVGIGVTMLLHCDLVFIAESARLRAPFVSLGIATEAGSSVLFPDRLGWQNTAHLLFGAPFISAPEAVDMGLAWRSHPDGELMDEVLAYAETIAVMPVSSLVENKRLLLDVRVPKVLEARPHEEAALARVVGSPANREAIAAFMQKRKPDFSGL